MSLFKSFAKPEAGYIAIMFGLSLVPVIAAAGAMIDVARFMAVHTQLQAALEAGTLAAATTHNASDVQRIKIGSDVFAANMKLNTRGSTVRFTMNDGTVSSHANFVLPTALMAVVGIESLEVSAASEAEMTRGIWVVTL